jgi:hypothetical protein
VNKAPGLLLTIGLMVELVENNELGPKVAAKGGSKGLLWTPLPKGGMVSNRVPGICCG